MTADARDNTIYENAVYSVGPHRKPISDATYVSVLKKDLEGVYPTFLDVVKTNDKGLSALFNSIAGAAATFADPASVFWMINVKDERISDKNLTHSQGSYPHAHIVGGTLDEAKRHIATQKTYTPHPKDDFNKAFAQRDVLFVKLQEAGPFTVYSVPQPYAESDTHLVVTAERFNGFVDFADRVSDREIEQLRGLLKTHLAGEVDKGGARLVNDDKFYPTGMLTLRIQGGDQRQKWFELPKPPAV